MRKLIVFSILISIGIFSIAPSSISFLCKMEQCSLCNFLTHHIEKWINFFTEIITGVLLVIFVIFCVFFVLNFNYSKIAFYIKQKIYKAPNSVLFNRLKQAFSDGILEPQIYFSF